MKEPKQRIGLGTRDNFPKPVIDFTAREVAFRCSNPHCGAPTVGPGDPGKISNLGVAAHITGASKRGPRYDATLTSAQRRSKENAIHLCQNCGKLVDDAKSTHTRAQLLQWKDDAILLARRALRTGDIDPDGRLKLAREARHSAAVRILEACVMTRQCIFNGVARSDSIPLKHKSETAFKIARRSMSDWLRAYEKTVDALEAALLDFDVHWGRPPMAGQLLRLAFWLDGWHHALLSKHVPSADFSDDLDPQFSAPWSWDAVWKRDASARRSMGQGVAKLVAQLDAWARPFIASRDILV